MKNIIYFLTIILFLLSKNINAQNANWKWVRGQSDEAHDEAYNVAIDLHGNVYMCGYYAGDSISFGSTILYNNTSGFDDLYIVKYDSSGNLKWAHSYGGNFDDKGSAIATDAAGNIYFTGYFYSTTIQFGSTTLTNAGNVGDIFIVKYDQDGNIIRAWREGGPGLEIPFAIHVDAFSDVEITGRFSSNTMTVGTTTLTMAGSMDVFLIKYDSTGAVIWAMGDGSGSNDEGYAMCTDAAANIYVAGYFNQNALFGTIPLTTSGGADGFIAKYDSAGTVLWAKRIHGSNDDRATSVSTDATGNSYISGWFQSDSITLGNIVLHRLTSSYNAYIAKYDVDGNEIWAHCVNGISRGLGTALYGRDLYICGGFRDDSLNYGNSQLNVQGSTDLFILHCDTSGNSRWADRYDGGGESGDVFNAIAVDPFGNFAMAGSSDSDSLRFGISTIYDLSNRANSFVARMGNTITGIYENISSDGFIIYPNPNNGHFIIKNTQPVYIEIFSVTGQNLLSKNLNSFNAETEFDLSSFKPGIYFVKMLIKNKLIVKKIIIQ